MRKFLTTFVVLALCWVPVSAALAETGAEVAPLPGFQLQNWIETTGRSAVDSIRAGRFEEALDQLQPLADAGDPWAFHAMITVRSQMAFHPEEWARVLSDLEQLRFLTSAPALYWSGIFAVAGIGEYPDRKKGLQLLERSAEMGFAIAYYELINLHVQEVFMPRDDERALYYATMLAATAGPQELLVEDGEMALAAIDLSAMLIDDAGFGDVEQSTKYSRKAMQELTRLGQIMPQPTSSELSYLSGLYICRQGITAALLTIDESSRNDAGVVDAMMFFHKIAGGPPVPDGCVAGQIHPVDPARDDVPDFGWLEPEFEWRPQNWLLKPEGYAISGSSFGRYYYSGLRAVGQIDIPGCREAVMQIVLVPHRNPPEICRAAWESRKD